MNFFIEGLQGSGKSTLANRIGEMHPEYTILREGDYSPLELSWCAYVTDTQYREILAQYSSIRQEIEEKSHQEGDRWVICYTKIITDLSGFHKDLEQYEIYNNRISFSEFRRIVLQRFEMWSGDKTVFECSLFQNIVEDLILFRNISDQEIFEFYQEICRILSEKEFHILYLESENIAENISVIRKERSDDHGNELWFPLMLSFFNASPYAVERGLQGEEALLNHLKHRQELELRLCHELFPDRFTVLQSKKYTEIQI